MSRITLSITVLVALFLFIISTTSSYALCESIYTERSGNIVGNWAGVNQSPMLNCTEHPDDVAISAGWEFNDPGVTVRKSFQTPGNPNKWNFQLRRQDNRDNSFAQVRIVCCSHVADHTHEYLTGRGNGHNNTTAETGGPMAPAP